MKIPRDRVTVIAREPASGASPFLDVSRQNIGGKRKVCNVPCFPDDGTQGVCFFVRKENFHIVCLAFAVSAALVLAGCGRPGAYNVNSNPDRPSSQPGVVPMRIVNDDLGRRLTIPTSIRRAVSLAPSVTESIFAVGAGDRLVGDTTFCNYPEEAKAIQKVGDTLNPNMETIVALKPDVVFVSGASQLETFTNTLDKNGISVYVLDPMNLDKVIIDLDQLGIIFGTVKQSQDLVRDLQNRRKQIVDSLETFPVPDESGPEYEKRIGVVRVFIQISKEPLFTIGKSAFLNDLIVGAGGVSVTANVPSAFPKLSKETALALQPEAIILSDSPDNQEPNEVFKDSPAVKNGRVYKINADIISRPGPRLIDALEQIAKDLHPEKFK